MNNTTNIEVLARYMIIKAVQNGFTTGIDFEGIQSSGLGLNINNKGLLLFLLLKISINRIILFSDLLNYVYLNKPEKGNHILML